MSDDKYQEKDKEYKEKSHKEKNKKDDKHKSKDDVTVNVNVNCCNHQKDNVRLSAFRAFNANTQDYPNAGRFQQVMYPGETPPRGFDLSGEYDVSTSTFIPDKDGVYYLLASVEFFPNLTLLPSTFEIILSITINGASRIFDSESITLVQNPRSLIGSGIISASGIRQLNAGDRIEVFFASNVPGIINNIADATHFEGSRFPSPLENNNLANINTAEEISDPLNRKQ